MQIGLFDGRKQFKFNKPIRLIELFGGIGCQAKALENLNIEFEHYRMCDFDKYAVQSYNAVHGTNFVPSDITKITAEDLAITETDKYDYIMTYSFPCTDLSKAGQQKGMARNSGTRSGLLWEVERLLDECMKCEHYQRKTWSKSYKPANYHLIGLNFAYGFCRKYNDRCLNIKKCKELNNGKA